MTTALDNIIDAYPLTPVQSGMLYHNLNAPSGHQFVGVVTATVHGRLSEGVARWAWRELVARHDALRTAFAWDGLDAPMQVVHARCELAFHWHDDGDFNAIRAKASATLINIAVAPLLRVHIVREDDATCRMVLVIHHLVADGWSTSVLLKEFIALIDAARSSTPAALPEPGSFGDHVAWLDTIDHDADSDFWRQYLKGAAGSRVACAEGLPAFEKIDLQMRPDALEANKELTRRAGASAAVGLQVAFAKAVGWLENSQSVLFGLATSGRTSQIAGVEHCVGTFVNTLPIRLDLGVADPIAHLNDLAQDFRAREHVPQGHLASWAGLPPGRSIADIVLTLHATPEISSGETRITDVSFATPSNFALVVNVDQERGAVSALFKASVYKDAQVRGFLDAFEAALMTDIARPSRLEAIHGPELLGTPEDVVSRILNQAKRRPDAIAVSSGDETLTYGRLLARATGVAAALTADGLKPEARVALVLPRSADMIVAMLGTLMAGAAYVPVDASYPEERIAQILGDCAPACVLSHPSVAQSAVWWDITNIEPSEDSAPILGGTDDPAYVIYTSGSSGQPKGVEISRGSLAASQHARDQFYGNAPEAFLLVSPFAFDSSVVGIYWSLVSGGTLVIAPERAEQDMHGLGQLVARHSVTHTLMLPSLYRALLSGADPEDLASLRMAIVAGEPCPEGLPARHAQCLPNCGLANEYGPTEATVWALAAMNAPGDSSPIGIGKPIPGTGIYLLGEDGATVAEGEPGEICIAGPNLARGYLGRRDATDAAFSEIAGEDGQPLHIYRTGDRAQLRRDGQLDYLGRGDGQIKIRGHRVELSEVEAALTRMPSVDAAVVTFGPAQPASLDVLDAALGALPDDVASRLISEAEGA